MYLICLPWDKNEEKMLNKQVGLTFDAAIPKATTKRTFKATDKGRDLVVCEDTDDMFDKLKPVLDDLD